MNLAYPKKFKSLIVHKNIKYTLNKSRKINFGFFSIVSKNYAVISARQMESGRRFLVRNITRKSKVLRLVTVTQPLTKKGKLTRMGKGKGKFFGWVGYVKPGTTLYELGYIPKHKKKLKKTVTLKRLSKVESKFPFKIKINKRHYNLNSIDRKYIKNIADKLYKKRKKFYSKPLRKIDREDSDDEFND